MNQRILCVLALIVMMLFAPATATAVHDASATVVGNILSGNMLLAPLALLILIITLMM